MDHVVDVFVEEDWPGDGDAAAELFTYPLVEMLEPGGSRSFTYPREAEHSIIHWGETEPFGDGLPRTPEQVRAGVVPTGFVSRLPDPWPGPAPPFPDHPRPPLRTMLADLARFAGVYAAHGIRRHREG